MNVIALRGEPNCGKTETLKIVHKKMLKKGFRQVAGIYQDLGNNDFLDLLEFNNKKIGIVSQGDYARSHRGGTSVKKYLEDLKRKGADIVICACTEGPTKGNIQKAINGYQSRYIDKEKSVTDCRKDNLFSAEEVMTQLMNLLP
ncbi:ATP-binding protein [Porphyromonas gulae]|uniref:ATP-binding protein n=1 Tax=Porphyromonas gulae TaxID=111105 RepID=UPI0003701F86|nr:ATP-binding protein [Porphyromonas gulae]